MDFLWILIAFAFGVVARQLTMPPLIGFLLAGFVLNAAGVQPTELLDQLSEIGITLMLFTIGLKLDLKALFYKEVLGTSLIHTLIWVVLTAALLAVPFWLGLSYAFAVDPQTSALVAFALSFSSTVAVVKILEESSELKVRHGKLALAVLIIQDIVAVIFLVAATGKIPSEWAAALLLLPLLRPVLYRLLERVGHGELLPLAGFFLAFGGYELFSALGVKGDLGALVMGIVVAGHSKTSELYKTLMNFKDLFLIGFFLSIGFTALPTLDMLPVTVGLILLLLLKFVLFFYLFILMKMPGRVAYLTALALSNYSEFGLIVANVGMDNGWVSDEWVVIIAIAMSVSFLISTMLYRKAHTTYARFHLFINRFERRGAHQSIQMPASFNVLVAGMGRVGKGAYHALEKEGVTDIWGLESDTERLKILREENLNVISGDADDMEFWQQAAKSRIQLVMLALPNQEEMRAALQVMKLAGYKGRVAAVARYEDERDELMLLGVDVAFNYYLEVGSGFAAECLPLLNGDVPASDEHRSVPIG
ncbi:MAG TPA: potassium transporter Kef [Oceanospirillales bacterium]|nr:potassium transporter Kef [Oceanospirillaceae bacterium]HBS41453.1 potassium transporter Kef [Oceanospirillales bacterium]|tara:strand:- start:5792 stop:7393 length:1602 start_codon:yes stop_codon:yes gene_type:complete